MIARRTRRRRDAGSRTDLSVYDGQHPLGRVVYLGDEWRAELADGTALGIYATRGDAREAISAALAGGRAAG